ncbi:3-deoxy-D-manno-octulosonic acid transferase [Actibacterium sp.]|uniref:3-deoxy-D-manno-octulosonic acid transferase n=1 Tax=Actibacterium sp. TaxID=1872125 RepID=UPI003561ABF2
MFLYRFLLTLAAPFVAVKLLRGGGLDQRLGGGDGNGPVLWLHAASNGEATAARPLIEALLASDPALRLLITCNSETGRDLVAGWGLARVSVALAPLDYRWALARFLRRWQPAALIIVENELWPNRLLMMQARQRPVIVVSGRMSGKSARVWAKLPGLARRVLGALSLVSAQDQASQSRFAALGVDAARIAPALNLKLTQAPPRPDAGDLATLAALLPRDKTVLAASTHAGEDQIILQGFARAHAQDPDLRLILAPRHPRRGDEVAALIAQAGLGFARRAAGHAPTAPVYLADTLGEMPLWYALAGVTFVGGSLVPKGGHTPFEPAAFDSAILHGPYLENFAEGYAALQSAGGSLLIRNADDLTQALLTPAQTTALPVRAKAAIAALGSADGLADLVGRIQALSR